VKINLFRAMNADIIPTITIRFNSIDFFQPAVEAFFLVHATETSQSIARRNATASEPESRESQLSHINEQPPVSPGQPAGTCFCVN